jgi:hypothetical protein
MNNPNTVIWSHSDRQADFYELPTDGKAMHEALTWLLEHYDEAKLWMGVERAGGAELLFTCMPAQPALVESLVVYDEVPSIFEKMTGLNRACAHM